MQSCQGVPELVRRVRAVAEEALRSAAPRRAARTVEESGSEPGSCGGVLDWELRMDDQTGSIEGSFSFEGYCEEGLTTDGDADVEGQVDLVAGDIESLTIASDELRMRGEGTDVSTSLTVVVEMVDPDTVSTTLNTVVRDNLTSKTYWAEDYVTVATMEGDGVVMTLSGRWYDHDLGYVDLSTAEPFRAGLFEEFPHSGVLVVNGAAGTRAVLTALSSAECRVEADTDGNGVFEWDSGPVAWDDL